jgi:hypothetical protein
MLTTIKHQVNDIHHKPFNTFYLDYVSRVQDDNLDKEFNLMLKTGMDVNASFMQKLINNTIDNLKGCGVV